MAHIKIQLNNYSNRPAICQQKSRKRGRRGGGAEKTQRKIEIFGAGETSNCYREFTKRAKMSMIIRDTPFRLKGERP